MITLEDKAIAKEVDGYSIKSVEKAIKIIRAMMSFRQNEQMSVSEIAKRSQVEKSTSYRILMTLAEQGIVSRTTTGRFKIGIGLIQIGQMALSRMPFTSSASDVLRRLCASTGESAFVFVYLNNARICIVKHESPQLVRHYVPIGEPIPLYVGSSGKVLLSAMSDEQLNRYLKSTIRSKLGPNTICSEILLREEIRKIRQNGISFSAQERSNDSASLAVPIRNINGAVVAALSIAGPTERFSSDNLKLWEALIRKASLEISQIFGYDPNSAVDKWVLEKLY